MIVICRRKLTFFVELYLGLVDGVVEQNATLLAQRREVSCRVEQVAHSHRF